MEENEEKTLRNLNECRKIIDAKIIEFGGRIFKTEVIVLYVSLLHL